jgi:hypothetical protein
VKYSHYEIVPEIAAVAGGSADHRTFRGEAKDDATASEGFQQACEADSSQAGSEKLSGYMRAIANVSALCSVV